MFAYFEASEELTGEVTLPGDKSISHRAAILGALSSGMSRIQGYSPSADCLSTLRCLGELGVDMQREGEVLVLAGRAAEGFAQPTDVLDAGNSGTTMRLLTGALAGQPVIATIGGDSSLLKRPMDRIIEPLTRMGASIRAGTGEGLPPLEIRGGRLNGIDFSPPVASAQVKSAVLIAGLNAEGSTTVREKVRTRDHTERMLRRMGINILSEGTSVALEPGTPLACDIAIPGDLSSAAFLISAALVCPGSRITLRSVGLNPSRTGFLELLARMGASIQVNVEPYDSWEPRGEITARYSQLKAIDLSPEDSARAIDELPLVAFLATQADGITSIRGAGELRAKESDRIMGTVSALDRLGARIEEITDGMKIFGPSRLEGAEVSSICDHRLAMMLAVAGMAAGGTTVVDGWEWTQVSYPGFLEMLVSLGGGAGVEKRR
jgi:3-phosphoshikimate 1-carboxyvinyltransferase